jgi:hypothetical protein
VFYTCYYVDDGDRIPYDGVKAEFAEDLPSTRLLKGEGSLIEDYRRQINDDSTVSVILIEKGENGQPHITL